MVQLATKKQADITPEKLAKAGLKAFFGITEDWRFTSEQQRIVLGNPPTSTFYKWKKERQGTLSEDTLERISYIIGIYKALGILLPTEEQANDWIKKPNSAPLFNGQSALDKMLAGRVVDLADVRRYLDAQRG